MSEETDRLHPIDTDGLVVLLQEYFALPAGKAQPTSTLETLGLDSLALMELAVVLEERTGAGLDDQLAGLTPAHTVAQVADALRSAPA
ncbi:MULTISPECIES: acyl carrier protein [Streptomyces]|uniref:acyl carrier protein n=1 Tax=Streptomyces TaxID=1883 RepID=UPI001E58EA8C|nr:MULTISPECIES: acyl carrier protein [Streptomyces]UFQ19313.1 acyl carrier protein [Streptomyces huasconensis]WCL88933.1 acyl carrier protein [Streptomyces sp. JCM 35825]